jgi:competence protein ComEA
MNKKHLLIATLLTISGCFASLHATPVSLNNADVTTLRQIKGMSAYKAHAIVAYRNKNGEFSDVAELTKVRGFKRMKPNETKELLQQLTLD